MHASRLMTAILRHDTDAEFRYYGGDAMQDVGGILLRHYSTLAYMGLVQVVRHLPAILRGMKQCREHIREWQPDCVILVDYPGFNLKMAKWVKRHMHIPVYYYIAPKVWAWKEGRVRLIRKYVDRVFSILPFEVDFFRRRGYEVDYVGNPSLDEVEAWLAKHPLTDSRNTILLMPGSREAEVRVNLPRMLEAVRGMGEYDIVVSHAPHLPAQLYSQIAEENAETLRLRAGASHIRLSASPSFELLHGAVAALVTSGTATLETALFGVPQVVCYYIRGGWALRLVRRLFLKVPFVSLVNLIAGREVVPELIGPDMRPEHVLRHLLTILPSGERREDMMRGYEELRQRLGTTSAPERAASLICRSLYVQ